MEKILEQLGLEYKSQEAKNITHFYTIKNKDGSIRWLWNADAKTPGFLNFYHQSGLKSFVFCFIMQLIFTFKLQKWYFRKSRFNAEIKNDSPLKKYENSSFFVFTGTPGPNRKFTFYVNGMQRNVFEKWGHSLKAKKLIKDEYNNIEVIRQLNIKDFELPEVLEVSDSIKVNLAEEFKTVKGTEFKEAHAIALNGIMSKTKKQLSLNEFLELHRIPQRIFQLRNNTGTYLPKGITKKLELLLNKVSSTEKVDVCLAHGDFTAWNCKFKNDNKLYVFDWEFMNNDYPILFDAIHYVVQNGILINGKGWSQIKDIIYNRVQRFLPQHIEKLELYLDLYLLLNTINQLEVFNNQINWHTQVEWLLNTWNQAISESLMHLTSQRQLLISDIYDALYHHQYATLNKENGSPLELDEYSDLDICIRKNNAGQIIKFLKEHPLVNKFKNKKLSYTSALKLVTHSGKILSLDLIHEFKRRSMYYLRIENLINTANTRLYDIKVANPVFTARYVALFYGLNGASIPEKYKYHLRSLRDSQIESDQYLHEFHAQGTRTLDISKYYSIYAENQGLNRVRNIITYVMDTVKSVAFTKGMMISFSGVDGAGKSTLIEHTKHELEKKYRRRVVVLRHRPSIFPILSAFKYGKQEAEKKSVESLPRKGNNTSKISSLARFSYYYTDYIFGQFIIYIKHVLRGDIVLYDRFYFDFIHDSIRSNMKLPKWLVKTGFTFIIKPRTNFFLFADAETILKRKQELDTETIENLTQAYSKHFEALKRKKENQYHLVNTKNWEQSRAAILSQLTPQVI